MYTQCTIISNVKNITFKKNRGLTSSKEKFDAKNRKF